MKMLRAWLAQFRETAIQGYLQGWDTKANGGPLSMRGAKELAERDVSYVMTEVETLRGAARELKRLGVPFEVSAILVAKEYRR